VPFAEDTDEIWSSLAQLALDICAGQTSVLQVLDDEKPPSSAKRLEKMIKLKMMIFQDFIKIYL
jgi:hypothetical protein